VIVFTARIYDSSDELQFVARADELGELALRIAWCVFERRLSSAEADALFEHMHAGVVGERKEP
jgi:hypothetical protein